MLTNRRLERAMRQATSYDEWQSAARDYDRRKGLERWKIIDYSKHYDYASIRFRLDRLRAARARQDNRALLFALNEGIHGNMAGMGNPELYQVARFGTKQLIVDYVDEIVESLQLIGSDAVEDISFVEKLDFFRRAHHCFGRSALMMSGSGTLLYFHLGVVKTLWEQDLLPTILSGSSGGALVASLVSTRTKPEIDELLNPERIAEDIDSANDGSFKRGRFQTNEVAQQLEMKMPDLTFQEAYKISGRNLNISIAPAETHQKSRLLNAITAPNVYIREAVMASCAIPGLFPAVTLAAKNDRGERQAYLGSRQWVDGSISDDLPAKRLARLYGVNHYIVSQTNPHIIPFLSDPQRRSGPANALKYAAISTSRAWMNAGAEIFSEQLRRNKTIYRTSNIVLSVVNQDYLGDINILPSSRIYNPLKLVSKRTVDEVSQLMLDGARSTWPRIEMIRNQTKISRVLDTLLDHYESDYSAIGHGTRIDAEDGTDVELSKAAGL